MKTIALFVCVFFSAILFATLYGIIHDQFSFTFSPEYYTKFKFEQFGLVTYGQIHTPRIGAIFVGIFATWWVGIPFGIIFGLIIVIRSQTSPSVIRHLFQTYLHISIVAFAVGLIGLLYGFTFLGNAGFWEYWTPHEVINKKMFIAVGSMHTFSYLGGMIGLVYGSIRLIRKTRTIKQK